MSVAALTPQAYLQRQARWTPVEFAFWAATLLPYWLFPDYLSLASQIASVSPSADSTRVPKPNF